MRSTSAGISIAIHLSAVAVMAFLGTQFAIQRLPDRPRIIVPLTRLHSPRRLPGLEGGGGSATPLPASKGRLPPPAVNRVFVPPLLTVSNPRLPVSAALLDAPTLDIPIAQYGNPLGKVGFPSGGPGRDGIGSSCCGGVGDQFGSHAGGDQGVSAQIRYSTPPRLIYKIEPEYPDEARKARYEGTVVLHVEVDAHGRPHNLRVVRGLGLGMDERALEAVGQWRFSPAIADGKQVSAPVMVEVSFRLL